MLNPAGLVEKGKTCVVATEVRNEADFHHVGFTVFTSRTKTFEVPGLREMTYRVIKEELGSAYRIIGQETMPDHGSVPVFKRAAAYQEKIREIAARRNADLVIQLGTFSYYPYGVPSGMRSDGFGYYGGTRGTAVGYCSLNIHDGKTGKLIKTYLGGEQWRMSELFDADYRSKWNTDGSRKVSLEGELGAGGFASLSAADKQTLMRAFEDLFRRRVRGMKKSGE